MSTFLWKREVVEALSGEGAMAFLDLGKMASTIASCGGPGLMPGGEPARAAYRLINDLVATGDLIKVRRNLYLNMSARPQPHPNEAAQLMQPGAIVSLHTVLGEKGILNNPSRVVVAIVPTEIGETLKRVASSEAATRSSDLGGIGFRFHGMTRAITEAGAVDDRLDGTARYPRATPERAIADWLYIAERSKNAPRGQRFPGLPLDSDLSGLDDARLRRCCEDLGVAEQLDAFLARKAEADADPDVEDNTSSLGF